jgi:hypothetical protein
MSEQTEDKTLVVIDHYLDRSDETYRLTIGYIDLVPVPVVDEAGEPVVGEDGEPITEEQEVAVPVEDFVFAAFDDSWKGKGPDEIVREQKRQVRAALRQRQDGAAPARERLDMPGVGDAL